MAMARRSDSISSYGVVTGLRLPARNFTASLMISKLEALRRLNRFGTDAAFILSGMLQTMLRTAKRDVVSPSNWRGNSV